MSEKFVMPVFDGTEESANNIYDCVFEAMVKYKAPMEALLAYTLVKMNSDMEEFVEISKLAETTINDIIYSNDMVDKMASMTDEELLNIIKENI